MNELQAVRTLVGAFSAIRVHRDVRVPRLGGFLFHISSPVCAAP